MQDGDNLSPKKGTKTNNLFKKSEKNEPRTNYGNVSEQQEAVCKPADYRSLLSFHKSASQSNVQGNGRDYKHDLAKESKSTEFGKKSKNDMNEYTEDKLESIANIQNRKFNEAKAKQARDFELKYDLERMNSLKHRGRNRTSLVDVVFTPPEVVKRPMSAVPHQHSRMTNTEWNHNQKEQRGHPGAVSSRDHAEPKGSTELSNITKILDKFRRRMSLRNTSYPPREAYSSSEKSSEISKREITSSNR
uniref:uncharacterized protein LOC120341530 n=1 Tax=Styela clava TaxID=7725 RepID=UPI00193A4FC3|nr:uncharacterized protein LOC120341530 [Styela clava]